MHPMSRIFAQVGALAFMAVWSVCPAQAEAPPPSEAPPPLEAPTRAADVAGRYAVLREEGRDTGCMVTLSTTRRGKGFRAQLAPACRDQGIVVFDPVGWWLQPGKLHLQARKGHDIDLAYGEASVWLRDGERPLGLKRIVVE